MIAHVHPISDPETRVSRQEHLRVRERMGEVGEGWCGREQIRHTIPLCELFIRGFVHLGNSLLNRLLGSNSGLLLPKQRYHLKCSSCRCCCCGSMMIVAERLSQKFGLPYYCSTPCHACHGFSSSSMSFPAAAVATVFLCCLLQYNTSNNHPTVLTSVLSRTHSRWRRNGLDCYCCCVAFCNLLLPNEKTLQSCIVQWGMDLYLPSSSPCLSDLMLHRGIWWTHFRTRKK